jgi:hypothetical protein
MDKEMEVRRKFLSIGVEQLNRISTDVKRKTETLVKKKYAEAVKQLHEENLLKIAFLEKKYKTLENILVGEQPEEEVK